MLSPTSYTHTIIIMHGERKAKTTKTTTWLNRRYLAEHPAGVINRELFEAPGTRRPHIAMVRQAALVGHRAHSFLMGSCNFVYPMRLMKYLLPIPFFCVLYIGMPAHFSFPRRMREIHTPSLHFSRSAHKIFLVSNKLARPMGPGSPPI